MQKLLAELLLHNEEIDEAAARICQAMPEYRKARQACEEICDKIQGMVGFELCDQLRVQFQLYSGYEVRAYYCLGLGLREELVRALRL